MIARDGYRISLWQESVPPYQPSSAPKEGSKYDVIIVGGGITGLSTGLLLQESGKSCLIIEANTLCFGTTGGTTAHLNTFLDTPYTTIRKNFDKEAAVTVANSTKEAIALIMTNIKTYGIDCDFSEADAYLFAQNQDEDKELEAIAGATLDAGLEVKFPQQIPIPHDFTSAICVTGQAKFNPVRYVYGLAKAFEHRGGHILQNVRVTAVDESEMVEVSSAAGRFFCKDLIYATHIPPGVNLLHLRCAPWRSYAMAVKLNNNAYPKDLCYDMVDPYHYYRTQILDDEKYLIVGGKDHKTGHEENTESCFLHLEAQVRKIFDVKEVTHKWSSQYYESTDGLPYIGHLPGHPGRLYVASGYGGNGMTYSSVAALALHSLLHNQETDATKLFNPNRIKPVAGFTSFIQHNVSAVGEFVSRLFSGEKLNELADLAPGEARLVRYENEKIAVFKDEDGALHAVNPVCTHLKCEVKWNNTERSWDCPCHGARYNFNGKVLTGPADRDVETIQIEQLTHQ